MESHEWYDYDVLHTAKHLLIKPPLSVTESLKSKYSSSACDTRICQFEIVLLLWQIYQMFLENKAASALDRDVLEQL